MKNDKINKTKPSLRALIVGAAVTGFALPATAHHPSAVPGGGTAGPVVTHSPDTLPAGKWSLSTQVEYINLDDIPDSRLEQFGAEDVEGVHGIETILATHFSGAVGICDDFMLTVSLPLIRRTDIDEGHHESPGVGEVEKRGIRPASAIWW